MIEVGGKSAHPKTLLSHQYHCLLSLFFWYMPPTDGPCFQLVTMAELAATFFFFMVLRALGSLGATPWSSCVLHCLNSGHRKASNLRRSHLPAYLNSHSLQGVEVLLVSIDHQSTWSISFSWKLRKKLSLTCIVFDIDKSPDCFFHT